MYLSDEQFQQLFGMDKAAWAKVPGWKKPAKKKEVGLF
jgi:hypothetical protein